MSNEDIWHKIDKPDIKKRFEAAKKIHEKMGIYGPGGQVTPDFYEISSVHTQGVLEWCFGMVWGDETLEPKMKEVAVIAAMVAQDLPAEIEWHVQSGLNLGLTREEIIAVIVQCTPYCGLPKVNHGLAAALKGFKNYDEGKSA